MTWDLLQWFGCAAGVGGAWLLGKRGASPDNRAWGWILFLVSNGCWIAWGMLFAVYGLLLMQALFTITSVRGLINALSEPSVGKCHRPHRDL